ncbi:DEAD/DEAH box helicase [Candidatus Pacearchaeota archaeon]|jgi:SNF2 family DNA or RNA helicase|nr:DEAD/DEAH box helicase [Candidatus Pacearchaeota archaeon]
MKTAPMKHQSEELFDHGADPIRAVFWEQGLGKTWLALAEAERLYQMKNIDALFVLAPNGIHSNWANYELPPHLGVPFLCHAFHTSKAGTKTAQNAAQEVLNYRAGLAVLVMSYDGIKTEKGKALAKAFLTKRKCFYVCDESNRVKTPSAAVTRTVLASGKYAGYKRVLCGTPITNSPFDVYSQIKFLDPTFWERTPYGLGSFQAFKTFFGVWEKGYNRAQGRKFDQLTGYKNLELLKRLLEPLASRLLKEEVLDLPPKVYTYRGFDLTAKQRTIYCELETKFMTMLDGELIMAPLAITRMLRLQQITCGYLPLIPDADNPNGGHFLPVDSHNPRIDLLQEIVADLPHKFIVWARFRADIDAICAALGSICTRWDGSLSIDAREENKRRFLEDPSIQGIAATPESMGEGHTLTVAKTEIYYSNSFKLKERLQSEDRAHRIGTDTAVNIIDIIANDTLDVKIVAALRQKLDVASMVLDKSFREWLKVPPVSQAEFNRQAQMDALKTAYAIFATGN